MSVSLAMILLGGMLIYGGWTNRSIWALARGDNQTAKPKIAPNQSGVRSATGG